MKIRSFLMLVTLKYKPITAGYFKEVIQNNNLQHLKDATHCAVTSPGPQKKPKDHTQQ
jgi:hypothetical protein